MEHESDCDSYDGEVINISADESRRNTSMSEEKLQYPIQTVLLIYKFYKQ
jgi:hypothetical protein